MDIHHAANRLRQKRQKEIDMNRQGAEDEDAGLDGLADLAQAALIKVKQCFPTLSSRNTY